MDPCYQRRYDVCLIACLTYHIYYLMQAILCIYIHVFPLKKSVLVAALVSVVQQLKPGQGKAKVGRAFAYAEVRESKRMRL